MSFPGISSSPAGAEPGRSGFPASYTSLLNCPLGCPAEGGFSEPLSGGVSFGQAGGRSQPCKPGLGRRAARDHTSAQTHPPSAVAFKRGWAGFPVPAAPCSAERTGAIIPTRNEVCAKRGGCESAATTRYQAKGSIANLTGTSDRETPPGAIRVGLAVDVSQSATSERMDVTAGRDRHPLSGLRRNGAAPSAEAWKVDTHEKAERDSCQGRRITNLSCGQRALLGRPASRSSARPALDLPTGFAFSPWVSASITCPGVRTSSPTPGAFAGLLSTGDFDNDHRH